MISANPTTFLVIASISLLGSGLAFFFGNRVFRKFGLLDNPGPYGHDRDPVPLGFWLLLYLNFLFVSAVSVMTGLLELSEKLIVLAVLWGLVTALNFIDDLDTIFKFDREEKTKPKITTEELSKTRKTGFAISPKARLAMQVLVGLVVGLTSIKISYVSNIFGGILYLDFFSVSFFGYEIYLIPLFFTVFWYVLVFNSVNWSDGVPGLTVGLATITLFVILVSTVRFYLLDATPALRQNALFVFGLLAIVMPPLVWTWHYSMAPKILIGDSGTMFLAFMIASLAILVGGKVATVATALWVYLVDAIYVIFARISRGKNPLKGDRIHHLHYRLKAIGMSDAFIRNFVYSISLFFGISAIFLDKVGKILLFVALALVIVFITKILSLKRAAESGFSLVELLVVMTLISLVSVTGYKIFSSLGESAKNSYVQSRISNLVRDLDREVGEGTISDYSMLFSKGQNGVIVNLNAYRTGNPVQMDYDWATKSGTLAFSGSTKPGYALVSENRTYKREIRTNPEAVLAFALSGTFDLPQRVIPVDDAVRKNVFLVYPLDTEVSGTRFPTSIGLPDSLTGVTLRNVRSQKTLSDGSGTLYEGILLQLTRWDSQFHQMIAPWK